MKTIFITDSRGGIHTFTGDENIYTTTPQGSCFVSDGDKKAIGSFPNYIAVSVKHKQKEQ